MADSSRKPKISLRALVDKEKNKIVLTLLECLFSSDTPLTDALLRKQSSRSMNKMHLLSPPALQDDTKKEESRLTLNVVVRKQDRKIIHFECREDFVNLLFTFLTFSLEFVLENSGGNMLWGCILNLFRSFKDLSCETKPSLSSKSKLPWYYYYSLQKQLLDIDIEVQPRFVSGYSQSLERHVFFGRGVSREDVVPVNPKCQHSPQLVKCNACKGFVKGNMKFRVSDDLIITPLSSSSTIGYLKQFQVSLDDVDVQEISIGKIEVNSLLRSSLMTSTVLSNTLWNLLMKKPKEET